MRLSVPALISNGLILTGGAVFQAVIGLGAQLVLMRLLVPEDFGRFAVILASCSLVQAILSLRLNILIIRVPEEKLTAALRERYVAALLWETAVTTAVTLIWLTFAGLTNGYALLLVATLATQQWTNQAVTFYERRMAYGAITVVETGSQLAGHAISVAVVLAGGGAIALYLREAAVAVLRLAIFSRMRALPPFLCRWPRPGEISSLMCEARACWLEGVTDSGFARVVILVTNALVGLHGAGLLAQSQRLALIPHQFLSPIITRLSANAFSRATDLRQRRHLLIWLVGGVLVAQSAAVGLMTVLADPLVPIIFGAHWAPATTVLLSLAGFMLFHSAFETLRIYCLTMALVRWLLLARLGQFAIFLGGALLVGATNGQGVSGLAWALSAATATAFFLTLAGLLVSRRV